MFLSLDRKTAKMQPTLFYEVLEFFIGKICKPTQKIRTHILSLHEIQLCVKILTAM